MLSVVVVGAVVVVVVVSFRHNSRRPLGAGRLLIWAFGARPGRKFPSEFVVCLGLGRQSEFESELGRSGRQMSRLSGRIGI